MNRTQHAGSNQSDIVFETRYVSVNAARVKDILPYVLDSFHEVGCGAAVAAADGIQLTYAVELQNNLVATIDKYSRDGVPARVPYKVYDARIVVSDRSVDWQDIVAGLGIVPSDIQYRFVELGVRGGVLIFVGPTSREAVIAQSVIPQIESALAFAISKVLYPSTVSVPKSAPDVAPMIESLGLCPADMTYILLEVGDEILIAFSGPPQRESIYMNSVLPSLRKLVGMITS